MYQPMLFVHWKQVRVVLVPFVVAAFALPLLVVQGLGVIEGAGELSMPAYRMVAEYQIWLPVFPLLALAVGVTLALSAWSWDHQSGHVYALSLPMPRWEYAMLKMGAGAVLALVPAAALWLGAHVAAASLTLPEGLQAYPNQLAARFFLAILLSYATFFALAAGTIRTTVWLVSGFVAFLVVGGALNEALAHYFEVFEHVNLVEIALRTLVETPGPLEVFTGNWSLIDV